MDENRISELIDAGLYRQKQETTIMEVTETKESKRKREVIIKKMLINFGEHCELFVDGIKEMPLETIENWAHLIIIAVEKN